MSDARPGTQRGSRARWEAVTSWPLLILSVLFLVVYSWCILEPDLPAAVQQILVGFLAVVWIVYLVDYLVRLALSRDRKQFAKTHVIDLLSVLVPVVRPFRLLTYLMELPYFKRDTGGSFRAKIIIYGVLFVVLFVYVISLAVLQVERPAPGALILSFGDSVWWACVTIATVGYGDFYPVTVLGRILAVALMAGGVAIVGTATATLVSYLGERIRHPGPPHDQHDPREQ
ncbi:potassium channel family protein [Compostimonas suwonensis]|uniref:Voltage-gated potassium channel n=1 Tax=Compostimonas suwonensis TaxID=1048394 RepID=A0A2M9BUL0_9MICO|nr:potassium channel family protein [Compostimonas suwonensis]PJJ61638.1 voltage-gated potassium channel [Compostimonas suwonensis]